MKSIIAILTILVCSFYSAKAQSADAPQPPEALISISSTSTGGNWSSPSTWVGGVVPTAEDNAIIVPGATVVIDADLAVSSVDVGVSASRSSAKPGSFGPSTARLTFEESSPHALRVWGYFTIASNGIFSTGGGTVNTHLVTLDWHIFNNGVLDLSTNNGQAGANLKFVYQGDSYITGTGTITDVQQIELAKTFSSSQVTLETSNFSVQGSTTDTAGSGFLVLTSGTFNISGTFAGTHRTLATATIPINASMWLNNPNYTVAAQPTAITVNGLLLILKGTFNSRGLEAGPNSVFRIGGGSMNSAGSFRIQNLIGTDITGGTVKACTDPSISNCVVEFSGTPIMSGGDIVIQNSGTYKYTTEPSYATGGNLRGTKLHFGNAQTTSGNFTLMGQAPNVILDASAMQIEVSTGDNSVHMNNLNISANSILNFVSLNLHGTAIINNGQLKRTCIAPQNCELASLNFDDLTVGTDITYSGNGFVSDYLNTIAIRARSIRFQQSQNLPAYNLFVRYATVTNAEKLTLGNFNTHPTRIDMYNGAVLPNAPDFRIGSTPQSLYYNSYPNGYTIGPELNASRNLDVLSISGSGTLNLTGGDLKVNVDLALGTGTVLKSDSNTVTARFSGSAGGYVDGNLRMQINPSLSSGAFLFPVGSNGRYAPAKVTGVSGTSPSFVTVRAIGATLPGLYAPISAARYWQMKEEGNLVARLEFTPAASEMMGTPANYERFRKDLGTPVLVTDTDIDQLTGDWGLGVLESGPVVLGGTITSAGGQPLRNATVTISGGNLPAPITIATGSFGAYSFSNLQPYVQYRITVSAKRYRFSPNFRTTTPTGNLTDINFAASPQ